MFRGTPCKKFGQKVKVNNSPKRFLLEKMFGSKKFVSRIILGRKNVWSKNVRSKQFGTSVFLVKTELVKKWIWLKKMGSITFWSKKQCWEGKDFGPKYFRCKSNISEPKRFWGRVVIFVKTFLCLINLAAKNFWSKKIK